MPYSIIDDILQQIPESELILLTTEPGDEAEESDEDIINGVITRVDSEIDSYVGVRYSVPLDPVPLVITQRAIAMVLHYLYSRRPAIVENETIRKNFEDALDWLKSLAKGIVNLGIDPAPANANQAPRVKISSNDRKFSDQSMDGY